MGGSRILCGSLFFYRKEFLMKYFLLENILYICRIKRKEEIMPLVIDKNRCPQNHRCPLVDLCPKQAISQEGFGLPRIDRAKCIECGKCVRHCGKNAVYQEN